MSERLKMLSRVTSLANNRQEGLDLIKQLEASDLSDDTRDSIIAIMKSMGIIRETDVQGANTPEASPGDEG